MLEVRPLNTIGVKAKFTSAEGDTTSRRSWKSVAVCPHPIPDTLGSPPLLGLVKLGFTICSLLDEI
jgi:hypothetical protein